MNTFYENWLLSAHANFLSAHANFVGVLDHIIGDFIERHEGTPLRDIPLETIARHGEIVKLPTDSMPFESFFVWRKGAGGVLGYRFTLEATLQTQVLGREDWPEPLAKYLKGGAT